MKACKKTFCLLLTVIMTVCAFPVLANAETSYLTREISESVDSVISVTSDYSAPSVTHISGPQNYYVCEATVTGGYHYSRNIIITKPGNCSFRVSCQKYSESEREVTTYTLNSTYPDNMKSQYCLKTANVNQAYSIKDIVEDIHPDLKIEKYNEPLVLWGLDKAAVTNKGTASSPDYSVKVTAEGFVRMRVSYKLKGKTELGSDNLLFKAGGCSAAVVFWAEDDGSSGDVTNMPSPNFKSSPDGFITLPDTVPKRAGYVFVGWTETAAHRSEAYAQYQPGKTYFFDGGVTTILFPVWSLKGYELTFDSCEGTGAPDKITCSADNKCTIPNKTPTKSGYTFVYWVDSLNNRNRTITAKPGDVITLTKDTTLYAVYEMTPTSIDIISLPTKTMYTIGDSLDLTGLSVVANYPGKIIALQTKELTITGFSASTAGVKTVTVTYLGKTASFTVTVKSNSGGGQDTPGADAPVYDIKPLGTKKGVKYNMDVTLHINLEGLPADCRVTIDDEDVTILNNSVVYKNFGRLTADKTFTLKVLYGDTELDSEIGTIIVPHKFFDQFIAFFVKLLMGKNMP